MSQTDGEHLDVSEDNGNENEKLVPVTEAIRYRKRAQQAEKQLAEVQEQLSFQREQAAGLGEQLETLQRQNALREALIAAGTSDLETTLLLGQTRLAAEATNDAASVVQQLCIDKPHLFAKTANVPAPGKTAALRHRPDGKETLDNAAMRAVQSGSRADVQKYLQVRRRYR